MLEFDQETIELLKKSMKKNGYIQLPAIGNSMYPLIHSNDLCRFEKCEPDYIKKGEILLFHSKTGQLVAHRFYGIRNVKGILHYLFKGDTNLGFDQPIKADQLIGRLSIIEKKHQVVIMKNNIFVSIWGGMISTFPFLSGLLRKYLNGRQSLQQWSKRLNN